MSGLTIAVVFDYSSMENANSIECPLMGEMLVLACQQELSDCE